MKKILALLSGLAVLGIYTNSFAAEGSGYKIISETHRVTGANSGYIEMNISEKKSPQNVAASVTTRNVSTDVMQYTKLDSYHGINIVNTTNKTVVYTYELYQHCEAATSDHVFQIQLDPGGRYNNMIDVYQAVQAFHPGRYDIFAYTKITGPESTYVETHATLTAT